MKEKTVKSPGEGGEYLLSEDVEELTNDAGETAQFPCVCVYFRKDGETEWESWKTVRTWDEAEWHVAGEVKRHKA